MINEFQSWMLSRDGRKTGYKLLFTPWLFWDLGVGLALTYGLKINAFQFAEKALFPAASILVGMAIAWTARASAIINDRDFQEKVISDDNPIEDYIYGYQLSILVLFSCVVIVAIMAAGGFKFFIYSERISYLSSSIFMYAFLSLTLRECWSIINFTNLLSVLSHRLIPKNRL